MEYPNVKVQPPEAVLEWLRNEIHANILETSQLLVDQGLQPIMYDDGDVEVLLEGFIDGMHERNMSPDIYNRFGIEEVR